MARFWKFLVLWLLASSCVYGETPGPSTTTSTTTTTPLVCRSSPTSTSTTTSTTTTTTTTATATTTITTTTTTTSTSTEAATTSKPTTKQIPYKLLRRFFHRPGVGFQRRPGFKTGCLRSCYGIRNGKYPSCLGCNYIAVCYHGNLFLRKCYPGYDWDAYRNTCTFFSSTCSLTASHSRPLSRTGYHF